MPNVFWIVIALVALVFFVVIFAVVGQFLNLYIQALLSKARVGILDLIGMRLRKVDIRIIVLSRIRSVKAGIEISSAQLETHYLAGGRVPIFVCA